MNNTEAHVPTLWCERAVVIMDSCFTGLVGAHQHGIASTVSLNDHVYYCRDGCKNTPLSASSTLHMWYLLAGN